MVEVANFKKQEYGADVATIHENDNELLEILRRTDGMFELIVHNRRGETDRWDDLSVTLKPQHFVVLGSIADMATPVRHEQIAEPLRAVVNSICPPRGYIR